MALISVSNLSINFGDFAAVKNATFQVQNGERVAIVGESGSGKSTLARAIIGLLPGSGKIVGGSIQFTHLPSAHRLKAAKTGQLLVPENEDTVELVNLPEKEYQNLRGNCIGYVPQNPMTNLDPVINIGKQVKEVFTAHSRSGSEDEICETLTRAGLKNPDELLKHYPHQYSGGMLQRVLIGIGTANKPELLIADEPTSALDVTVQKTILDNLEQITEEIGAAWLLITHDLGLAAARADRIIVMHNGEIVENALANEIINNPQDEYTKRLLAADPSLSEAKTSAAENVSQNGAPILSATSLVKEFPIRGEMKNLRKKKFRALDNVSISLQKGKTLAVVGESGSGKSTLANLLLGLEKPTGGVIEFQGKDLAQLLKNRKGEREFRAKVQPVFQDPAGSLDPMWTVGQLLIEPFKAHKRDLANIQERITELLNLVGLPEEFKNRFPGSLSGGQQQRVNIARAIALNPEIIILDEAVSALDVIIQKQILDLLTKLQQDLGLTYLFITHDLAVVKQIADAVVVMKNGRVVL